MSDDDKHKLYQAAAMTGDAELVRRVSVKIGLMDDDYTPGDNYQEFLTEHVSWVFATLISFNRWTRLKKRGLTSIRISRIKRLC